MKPPESSKKRSLRVCTVIPAHNASGTIAQLLRRLEKQGVAKAFVVDDGSKDGTGLLLRRLSKKYPFLRVITHKKNEGAVQAVMDGYSACLNEYRPCDIVVRMDSDLEHPPEKFPELLKALEGNALAVAQIRYPPGSFDSLFNHYAGQEQGNRFVGKPFTQFCPGFMALRAETLEKILPDFIKLRKSFLKRFDADLVAIDAIFILLASRLGGVAFVTYHAVAPAKRPLLKTMGYARLHRRVLGFLHDEGLI